MFHQIDTPFYPIFYGRTPFNGKDSAGRLHLQQFSGCPVNTTELAQFGIVYGILFFPVGIKGSGKKCADYSGKPTTEAVRRIPRNIRDAIN